MHSSMVVTCWGVRGSIPSPGDSTVRHGGNTSCVSIDFGTETTLILDAGSGIRRLGENLAAGGKEIFILVTHFHSDHIQGFPFFSPLFQKDRAIRILARPEEEGEWSLLNMIDGFHFPLRLEQIPSRVSESPCDGDAVLAERGIRIRHIATNHPGGAFGYRVEYGGRSVVFIPDNEILPPTRPLTDFDTLAEFCRGADLLIHDAQYVDDDLPMKWGWGHSTADQACSLAMAAEVRRLILFHHDPERTDDQIDSIERTVRARLLEGNGAIECTAAYEGMSIAI